ncbi:sensor domain-containing phosphodiesterase [Halorhodospira sp. M39old]|uniref:sensor domain-containing phosphodiesterase n=4 Tax=unclassified Halorhodospira TaxID=2626748 RepID=UPI001EE83581|nr:EAL domain-containing protein [Halorhodospira sp. M39old]MCG5541328.1 EAL domain-containing protein [Halorhodospira sp. M39old]
METKISEEERLRQVRGLELSEAAASRALQELLALAEELFHVPIVRIHLIEAEAQRSLAGTGHAPAFNMARDQSVCTHTIEREESLILPDLAEDGAFREHPLVTGAPFLRFYAGAVLRTPEGGALGTLCLIDYAPRAFTAEDECRLIQLARVVEIHLTGGAARSPAARNPSLDEATGLPTRASTAGRVAPLLEAAAEGEHPAPLALMSIYVEDAAGLRASGQTASADRLLAATTARLRAALPEQTSLGHWEVNEILVWAPATAPGCDPETIGTRAAAALQEPITTGMEQIRPTIALSVVQAPDDGERLDQLTSLLHLLTSNQHGASRVRVVQNGTGRIGVSEQIHLVQRLDEALDQGCIEPHYQPRFDLTSGAMTGMEALARWHDPKLGWISPGEFIPLAERTGRIEELTGVILQAVCRQVRAWMDEGITVPPVAVNISPQELLEPHFAPRLRQALAEARLAQPQVELEITERGFSEELQPMARAMRALAEQGTPFAIDDFGTGYSSLLYLQQLPAQQVKIDRSFTQGLLDDPVSGRIVGATVGIAASLGMETVAEGVETAAEAEALSRHGVDQAQGFYYARPMPPGDLWPRLGAAAPA